MSTKVAEISKANVELVKTEPTRRRYGGSLSGVRLKAVESRWMDLAKSNVRLPGFRKGHVPEDVVVGQMGDWLKGKVMEELLRGVVEEIVRKDSLKVVSSAVVDKMDYRIGEKMNFELIFEVEPEFSVKDYSGLELKRHNRPVKDEEVEREFKRLAGSQEPAYLHPVPDASNKENLWALMDLKFFNGAKTEEPFWAVEYFLSSLGEDQNLPWGLRDAALSMKPGETKEISVAYDEDCPVEELRGKKGRMIVTLWEFKRYQASEAGQGLGLEPAKIAEIRSQIRKALEERFKQRERRQMQDQIVAALLERNPIEVSDAEVEERTKELIGRARTVLSMSGGKGLTEEHENELRVKYRIEAANDVRFSYIAREIAKRENIKVTEEEFNKQLESAENEQDKEYMLRQKESVLYGILMEKVFDFLISKAKVETVEV